MAVYTHISEDELIRHLELFEIGELVSFSGITEGIDNTNYALVTTQGKFILTLFEKRIVPEDIPFYISFMEYLHGKGIPCAGVIHGKNREGIIQFKSKPAIITTFLEGAWPRQTEIFHAVAVGKTLAKMHLAGKEFSLQRRNKMSLPECRRLIESCVSKADTLNAGIYDLLRNELEYQESNWPEGLPEGAVHADLFPDNVFFTGENLAGVIDFYFSCTDAFAYDLMLTVNAWCFDEDGRLNADKYLNLLDAYRKERQLTAQELEALPFFGRAAALRIIATRLYDWIHPDHGAIVKLKDPMEYVRILKFHQTGSMSA